MREKVKTYIEAIKSIRLDAWSNKQTGQGGKCDKSKYNAPDLNVLTEDDLEVAYRSDDVAKRIVNKLPHAALEKGFDLLPNDIPAYDYFWEQWNHHSLNEKLKSTWIFARLYGNTVLIFEIEDGREPSEPVDWNNVKGIRWVQYLEKRYYDVVEVGADPNSEFYRKPLIIRVQSNNIPAGSANANTNESNIKSDNELNNVEFHASRCIFFDGEEIPWNSYMENDYSHDSVLQDSWDKIANYESVYSAAAQLIPEIRLNKYKIPGWADIVASGQQDKVEKRLQALQQTRSVYNMVVMDEAETLESDTVTVSGLDSMMDKFGRRVVQASKMPHTIALGEGSEGNTSGRTETEEWAATVSEEQNTYLKPKLQKIMDIIFAQSDAPKNKGDVFEIMFFPIIVKKQADQVVEYKTVSEADNTYIMNGVMTPEDARKRFTEDGFKLDITLDEIEPESEDDDIPPIIEDENMDRGESFSPNSEMAEKASIGLTMRKQFGRGGTDLQVARARKIAVQEPIKLDGVARILSSLQKTEQQKDSTTKDGEPSNEQITYMLNGGDEGKKWAEEIFKQQKNKTDQSELQSIIFLKTRWSKVNNVNSWLIDHGYKPIKEIDETPSSYRARLREPNDFKPASFRTIEIEPGVKAILGELKQ